MAKSAAEKRLILIERTARILQCSEQDAAQLLRTKRQQSLRLNTLAGPAEGILHELQAIGWHGEQYPWIAEGYTLEGDIVLVRDSHAVAEGRAFIQNAASWLPVIALDAQAGDTVLDICAAPGGKTSHIAARTHNQARITANDNSRARLGKLRATLDRLGATNVETTLFDATQLVRKLGDKQFDRILLDAPCSGEGMMQLDRDKDLATWSVAHIKRLQQLQKRLLAQAWQLLKPGGILVYSTCTIAPEENEAVIDYLLRHASDATTEPLPIRPDNAVACVSEWNGRTFSEATRHCLRLRPSPTIEAFFVCILRKMHQE